MIYNYPATEAGMLGGDERHIEPDRKMSLKALKKCYRHLRKFDSAIDMAGGVGRISKILLEKFKHVDIEDINPKYLEKARKDYPQLRHTYATPIEDFHYQ